MLGYPETNKCDPVEHLVRPFCAHPDQFFSSNSPTSSSMTLQRNRDKHFHSKSPFWFAGVTHVNVNDDDGAQ